MKPRAGAVMLLAILPAAGLAACTSAPPPPASAPGRPVYGGTLRIVSNAGPGNLDPVPTYNYAGYELERGYARQLLTYPTTSPTTTSGPAWIKATTLVPDMATAVPSTANGGISGNGLVYTYHIRRGVDWNSKPPRQVTAYDFIREFQAFCNPTHFPVGNSTYFTTTISGFTSYCDAEGRHFGASHAPAAAVAAWQRSHPISGLSAPDPLTLRVRLIRPTSDFNDIMALPFVSARPAEYNAYLPGSLPLNQHTMSDGPYQVSSYEPGRAIVLTRNLAWKAATDPLRHQYVSRVVVTMGTTSLQVVLTDLQAGTQDLFLGDLGIPLQAVAGLQASHDGRLRVWPSSDLNPYIILNLRSPNAGRAISKLAVRQAIEYGVNKAEILKVAGGPGFNIITGGAIPPGNAGYQPYTRYATPGNQGDPAKCRSLLAAAGYPKGLTLGYLYPGDQGNTLFFEAIQGSLARCGINLRGMPVSTVSGSYFTDLGDTQETSTRGTWDLATGSWFPDWYGNNGRTTVEPLFQNNCTLGTVNAGCYDSPAVNSLINQALGASSPAAAASLWHQAAVHAMNDAAIVPLISSANIGYASSRVHSAMAGTANYSTLIQGWDFTNIWLNPDRP